MSMLPRLPLTILAPLVLAVAAAGCSSPPSNTASPPPPTQPFPQQIKPAPDFSLTAFDGTSYQLADLRGRPIVLFFWSSRCSACAKTAPHIEAFYQAHESDDLLVLGISGFDSEDALTAKASSLGITFPLAISPETSHAYGVRAVPMTFFIDRDGNTIGSILGAQPPARFEAALQVIL